MELTLKILVRVLEKKWVQVNLDCSQEKLLD